MWTQILIKFSYRLNDIINHLIIHYDGLYLKILLSLQPHHFYLQPIVYCEASLNACFMRVSCTLNRVPHN